MLEGFFLFFKGSLIFELQGEEKERFFNLCKNKNIELMEIKEINGVWFGQITCRNYKKIKEIVRKTGCQPRIRKKRGFPFLLLYCRKRMAFVLGILIFFLILLQCESRIWSIEVSGGYLHTRQQMLRVLEEEMGIYGGVPAENINCFEIEKKLRLDYNEIGWISVEQKGCCLFVMMNESVMPMLSEKRTEPCHIVAERDGVVKSIQVLQGIPLVKAGDIVQKGDILISGVVPVMGDYELVRNQPVPANGEVQLESQISYQSRQSMRYEKKNILDEKKGIGFFLFNSKIFSYIPRYSEGKYDIISSDIVPYYFEEYAAPVILRKYRCLKYETEQLTRTPEEAKTLALKTWEAFLTDLEEQRILVTASSVENEIKHGYCNTKGQITVQGNFISYKEIQEEEWKIENEYSGDNP